MENKKKLTPEEEATIEKKADIAMVSCFIFIGIIGIIIVILHSTYVLSFGVALLLAISIGAIGVVIAFKIRDAVLAPTDEAKADRMMDRLRKERALNNKNGEETQIAKSELESGNYPKAYEMAKIALRWDGNDYEACVVAVKAMLQMDKISKKELLALGKKLVTLNTGTDNEKVELCIGILERVGRLGDSYTIEEFLSHDKKGHEYLQTKRNQSNNDKQETTIAPYVPKKDNKQNNSQELARIKAESAKQKNKVSDSDEYIYYCDGQNGSTRLSYNTNNETITINGLRYNFSDIISYSCSCYGGIQISAGSSQTKTNTRNMVGRTIVGGMVGGLAGAVIGGATASKTTTTTPPQYSATSYKITIFVKGEKNKEEIDLNNYDAEEAKLQIIPVLEMIKNMK